MILICKKCGSERDVGRRLCKSCDLERRKVYPRYTFNNECISCKQHFKAWRKQQEFCSDCYNLKKQLASETKVTNNYEYTSIRGLTRHREIAETTLGRKLSSNEVVHHLDNNPKNNVSENLMLMSRHIHGKLHHYLETQRVIIEKSINENQGNCWNNLIVPMTTAWLEMTNAKVQKLSEIGQSAAEPLKVN